MSQPLVTGPVELWVGLGQSNTPLFLGYSERSPRILFRNKMRDVFTDRLGSEVPQDKMRMAGDAMVFVDLTFIEPPTYLRLATWMVPQTFVYSDVGLLVNAENRNQAARDGTSFPIWLPFRYRRKSAMTGVGNGYRFLCCQCLNEDMDQMGTVPMRKRLAFHCTPKYIPGTTTDDRGRYNLYDDDVSYVITQCIPPPTVIA